MAKNGLGDDGPHYAECAKDFVGTALSKRIDSYFIQRTLPSFFVWLVLTIAKVEKSDANMIRAFEWMNIVVVALSAYLWCKVARKLAISSSMRWFGTLVLFGSFAIIKWTTWVVVMTDTWGFALGMLLLWCYLRRQFVTAVFTTIAGAFAWPTILQMG